MRNFDLPGRSRVIAENGMAATSHPLATAVALSILKEGGNAVDAAIAAAGALSVVEPHMTGIGGDCFVILAEPDGSVHGLNGSGRAPAAADAALYREKGLTAVPFTGALPVTVPGAVDAMEKLARRFGTMGLDRLFAAAIDYAENGYAVHDRVARDWAGYAEGLDADPGAARHLLAGGKVPLAGTRYRSPGLAAALRMIAEKGSRGFYEGALAAEIAKTVRDAGGTMTEADLAAVSADWVTPISTHYKGYDMLEIPPNGQGIVALVILNILAELGADKLPADSAERYHMEIEAARLAYSVRDHMVADPAHMTVTPEQILSKDYAKALAASIDPEKRNDEIVLPDLPNSDTIYLSVVDRDRRAVSFIYSIYGPFGSKLVTPQSGIVLQNRGACFTLQEGHPNELKGGKRPMHTIIPAMAMKNGKAAISFGVMGGAYQPMGHVHVLSNIADYGMDAQEAIDHPRAFWDADGTIACETGIGTGVRAELEARGHRVAPAASPWGGSQMVQIDYENGFLIGASDPRKDGHAAGW